MSERSAVRAQDVNIQPDKLNHPRGFVPKVPRGNKGPVPGAASTNPNCPTCSPPLLFGPGSPVMGGLTGTPGHITITPFYWAPATYSYGTTTYKSVVNGYLSNVAAASRSNTNVFSVSIQYYQQLSPSAAKQRIEYVVAAGAEVDDATAFPSGGCTPAAGFTACVTDSQLQAELSSRLTAASLPIDDSHLYLVLFPQNVETCVPNANNVLKCSADSFCAYHSGTGTQPFLIYGNMPFPALNGCADPFNGPQAPNGDQFADAQASLISHEANEAITDWAGAWMDSVGFEDGDECAYVYGAPQGLPGAFYNQVINGAHYYTQDEFSNADFAIHNGDLTTTGGTFVSGCVQQEELPGASFTGPSSATAGTAYTFDGSGSSDPDGSITAYDWKWGDGTPDGAGVKPTHTFGATGVFTVTLTVTDIDGWQGSTSSTVTVVCPSPVVDSIAPSQGPTGGGTAVVITGCGLLGATAVHFGSLGATFTVVSDTQIQATSPQSNTAGTVDVTVTTPAGTSPTTPADRFTYTPSLSYFPWYDNASPGVNADTIHITNPGSLQATGTIALAGAPTINFQVDPGKDAYFAFPGGTIGGPVVITSPTPGLVMSLRAWYYQSFNETPARTMNDASTALYLPWYDLQSPGTRADTIHITNPGNTTATGSISLPNVAGLSFTVAPGEDKYLTFPSGTIGGPVTITSSNPVLGTLRAWYYQSFNETIARPESAAASTLYLPWYDLSSPGMRADTIHITNESGSQATGTISLPGAAPIPFTVDNLKDSYFSFPGGSIGGPVTIQSSQPVLATLRAWYYQSFNESAARPASAAATTQIFPWYDLQSPGMNADTIHITNPGATAASGSISVPGAAPISFTVAAGQDRFFAFPGGTIGGPVIISSNVPVLASLRAWYYQSFNEVAGRS